ncbi:MULTISPECIES: ABC transporter permease [Paraburkholderia]|jgi:putative spermidine/putrescine transport system permease protein|uniref:ABC transporter permease n=4 Tax=Paraburkholderia TaxID=1822464 RepID=A0A4R0X550_9BURK|nr:MULTISPECIES: ABC transporter permease [Paraburkholderia]AUT64394.1 ABC transporter permease [Paraburkholderia terrae]AUT73900.1 ABC transporter permease [Paraburkholderia hospita]AXF03549.1 ABC transporter permease [Paraburkholderia hospita]EIM99715.1 binding-protein-dependent transport system inner membrane protein [Paraburkholderia hospita]OUL69044.1 ABC transporter permease [Paraburkholderia hospita]
MMTTAKHVLQEQTVMQATTIDPSVRHQQREDRAMLLLMAPALLVVVVLLVVPLAWLSWQSIYHDGAFTLVNYQRVFTGTYLDTFLMTFKLSIIVTGITLLLGYPVAYFAASVPPKWSALILGMVILPFWTSVLVRTYAWLVLLQRTGLVNKALLSMGLIDRPLQLSYNQFGTIVAMVHILLPFMVLPLYSAMQKIPGNLSQAGASLGGSPLHVFWRVFLPLSMSGVVAGVTLVFVLCLGFYITPELMGGGKSIMVSMVVSRNVEIYNSWGAASAVSVVLLVCVFAIFYAASRVIPLEKTLGAK